MVIWQQGRKVPLAWSLLLLYTLGTNNSCSVLTLPNRRHSLPEDPHSTSTPTTTPTTQNAKFFQNQNIWSYFRTKLWMEILRFKPRSLAWWHLVGNIIRDDIKRVRVHLSPPLTHSTLEPCQAGRSLCTRDLVGCHGYKCQQGYACPGIFQTLSSLIRAAWTNRRGKQMHLSIEARKHEAGRLLKGEEFKGNPPFIYLPKTAGRQTASISHQRGFKQKKQAV